jgi:ribonuclease HII
MREEEVQFPGYGFAQNKGYGTVAHRAALGSLGPCPLHRRSFNLIKEAANTKPIF